MRFHEVPWWNVLEGSRRFWKLVEKEDLEVM